MKGKRREKGCSDLNKNIRTAKLVFFYLFLFSSSFLLFASCLRTARGRRVNIYQTDIIQNHSHNSEKKASYSPFLFFLYGISLPQKKKKSRGLNLAVVHVTVSRWMKRSSDPALTWGRDHFLLFGARMV